MLRCPMVFDVGEIDAPIAAHVGLLALAGRRAPR